MKAKKWIALSLLAVILIAGGAYLGYSSYSSSKESGFACVATSFPYIVMEHKRAELTSLLENIQIDEENGKEPDLDAVEKAMQGEAPAPAKFFLSKDIDTKMLEFAKSIQNRPTDAPPISGDEMTSYLAELEPLYKEQAPSYLKDCKVIFKDMIKHCGRLDSMTQEDLECRARYDDQVDQLLQKHLAPRDS